MDCISRHANYESRLQGNKAALQSACRRLTELRDEVKGQVEMADREQVQLPEQVRGWLLRVQTLETQVDQLIGDGTGELEQKCLGGCCPRHWRTRYNLGKRVGKMLEDVGELMREKPHGVVAERLPPPGVSEMASEATVGMDSKFDQVWRSLHDERVGIVGIYGLGGVGKTTLLTQINNSFTKRTHDFDFVMWATVSRNLNLDKIQDDIWEKIGFCDDKWKSKDRDGKAKSIWNVLSKRRFVLLLDDVWEWLKLQEVGVPCQNKRNKIVFTTPSEAVCAQMEADQKIKIECLEPGESLNLFRMYVGEDTFNCNPEIPKLAKAVAKECCGLPLALMTIGKAMACKRRPQEWKYAIKVLRSSASKFPGMGNKVLPLLKYSYDCIPTEVARSCFLYCSLFPEHSGRSKSKLILYWIYEGILKEFDDDIDGAINQGYNIIGMLIHAGLLEQMEGNDDGVKLHDVVRDMALWIACETGREKDKFLVQTGCGLTEAPEVGRWIGPKRISLMNNKIEKLVGAPNCPNLSTLFLSENPLKMISDNFFELMPNLRVLSLFGTRITKLPKGIFNLVSLQYLNLSLTRIKELPIELKNLGELKHLVLRRMPKSFSIPKQLISSLSKLQVIDIIWFPGIFDGATLEGALLSEENEVLVKELESLKYLRELTVTITTTFAFERLLRSDKLRACISHLILLHFNGSRSLNITSLCNAEFLSSLSIGDCNFEDFEIDGAWKGKETIESNCLYLKVSFRNLKHVRIGFCPRLKDLSWLPFAPNLKTLVIQNCDQMQEVVDISKCGESVENGENLSPFVKLEKLFLTDLPLLRSIVWKALPLLNLNKIYVCKCPLLKKLPLNAKNANGRRMVIAGDREWWNEVEWEDDATRDAFLPCFVEHVE